MRTLLTTLCSCILVALAMGFPAWAEDMDLLPKYGSVPKTKAQAQADQRFIADMGKQYQGDRHKAASEIGKRGWVSLRQGRPDVAMRRFNQAWLLEANNGPAIWGMAAAQALLERNQEALILFAEAQQLMGGDLDFEVDHARALGMIGIQMDDKALIADALARFAQLQRRAPEHVLNLQNWAITAYYLGNYAEAWQKIKLAEKKRRAHELDPGFLTELQKKMPRP